MPGLYGFTANSNVSVNVGNTTGLYQQNTGNVYVVNNAVTLLNTLSQAGNVNFALTAGNSKVLAYTANIGTVAGSYGSTTTVPVVTVTSDGRVTGITTVAIDPGAPGFYSNANVQAYLPTYTGSLANSSSIISLQANAVAQQSNINNLDAQYTSLNSTVISQGSQIGALQANAVTQQGQIDLKANIAGQVFTGNVQAPYFIGDGSQLTGIVGTYSNTNVSALLSSNTVSTITTTGNITTVANIVSPAYLYPNGVSILSGIGGTYSNTNVAAYLTTATIATTGNITAANLTTAGNVTGNYIKGNAELMTGLTGVAAGTYGSDTTIPTIVVDLNGRITQITTNAISGGGSYGNSNVASYLPTYNGALPNLSSVNTSGNITANAGGYFIGDGSLLTNLPVQTGTYSNTNVAAYLTTATITTSGNVTAGNLISANFLYPNGVSILTGIGGTYSNTNVAAYLTTATITTTGNLQGAYVLGDGSQLTNLPVQAGTYSNTNVAAYLTTATITTTGNVTAANLITNGNVSASYVLGDGSLLTNLPVQAGTYSNANVASYMPVFGGNIAAGNITATNKIATPYVDAVSSAGGALRNAAGTPVIQWGVGSSTNSSVDGSINLNGSNAQIDISPTGTGHVHINPAGTGSVEIAPANPGSLNNMTVGNVTPRAGTFTTLQTSGNITANAGAYFIGDGSQLTNLPVQTATGTAGGSLTGSYPNPDLATQSGITAGMFGNAITVPQITIAANGVATSASNVSIVFPVTSGFSGNLVGNTLTASGTGRILANASPQQNISQVGSYTQAVLVTNTPSYIGGNLIPQNQTVSMATLGNVNLLTTYANATLRTTNGTTSYLGVTATSANTSMNPSDRVRSMGGGLDLNLNGKSWGLLSSASNTLLPIVTNGQTQNIYGTGQIGQAAGVAAGITITPVAGSISAQYVSSLFGIISYSTAGGGSTASNINTARLVAGTITATGNLTVTNAIGLHTYSGWVSSNVSLVTNAYTVLNEDTRSIISTVGNIAATGALSAFGNTRINGYLNPNKKYSNPSSGNITVSGTNMQSFQQIDLNGNLGIVASANGIDLVFDFSITQDATGGRTLTWYNSSGSLYTPSGILNPAPFGITYARAIMSDTGLWTVSYSNASVPVLTVTQTNAFTGMAGSMVAVSNGTGKNNGQLAYWDVTNTRWSWVDSNGAVT